MATSKLALSTVSGKSSNSKEILDNNTNFEFFVSNACRRYMCPFDVAVLKENRTVDLKNKKGYNDNDRGVNLSNTSVSTKVFDIYGNQVYLVITTIYDNLDHLVEVVLQKIPNIPRTLMQVIALIVPFQDRLSKFTIRESGLDAHVIYELKKVLPFSQITDICLNGSSFSQANYAILLDEPTNLMNLSLSRCNINDEVCEQIALKLQYPGPAEKTLLTLDLASNFITDEGAKFLSETLRINRHLRHLNLSANRISDQGAYRLFDVLMEFPLTYNEILTKRRRYMTYLKTRQSYIMKYLHQLNAQPKSSLSKLSAHKNAQVKKEKAAGKREESENNIKKTNNKEGSIHAQAEAVADEVMEPFTDPFRNSYTKGGYTYCNGNLKLCYLNLAYNNLSHLSLTKLIQVLNYQNITRNTSDIGILKVVLDGNNMPRDSPELAYITKTLTENLPKRRSFVSKKNQG